MTTDDLKKKAIRGGGINVALNSVGFVFHAGGVIVLARLLTPKDFGLVAMVTAFSAWIMNFGINGFTEYIIQKKDINTEEINAIFWLHLSIASFLSVCFILFGFFLNVFYKEPALSAIAAVMASSFVLHALFTCHFALLQREMKFAYIAVVELMGIILSIFLSIAAAINGMGYWAVVTRQLTLTVVAVVAAWIIRPWSPQRPKNLANAIPALKYAFKVYCNFSLSYLMRNIDNVLLGKFHGATVLGNYDRAYYLSQLPANQLLRPLTGVALATLSRLRDVKKKFITYYTKAVSTVSFLGTIAAVVLMLTAHDLVLLILGPAWKETGRVLMALAPGIAAVLVSSTNAWLHLSLGQPGRWLRWNIVATIITIIAFVIAVPYGAVAMGIAVSAKTYILLLPGLWYAGRPIGLNISTVLRGVLPYFVAGLSTTLVWLYLPAFLPTFNDILTCLSPLSRVIITVCIAPLLYLTMVIILQRSFVSIRELIALLKIFLSR